MPSVMDLIRWKDKWSRMNSSVRNTLITDAIAWLESEERPKCKPEHVMHLVNFENELQKHLNQPSIPPGWFTTTGQTYGSFPFFEKFLRHIS